MKYSVTTRFTALGVIAVLVVGVVASVIYFPVVAAVAFLLSAAVAAVLVRRKEGLLKGIGAFLKDIFFGW